MKRKIAISRPINGISLNGDEFLLDENGEPMEFDSTKDTEVFLVAHGESMIFKIFVKL